MSIALALTLAVVTAPVQDARWELAPPTVAIGEPITARLVVEHAEDARPDLGEVEPELDDSWVVLEAGRSRVSPVGSTTERTWSVLSLEPGARTWPEVTVELADGTALTTPAAIVEVAGELAPEEDTPRPLPGFHPVPERAGPLRLPHLLLGLLLGLIVAAGWWWTTRRAGIARAGEEEDELARLASLVPPDWDAPGVAREYAWGLATLLRAAAGRGLERGGQGLSEEELVAARRTQHGPDTGAAVDELEALLAECARIKYAGERPTRFALEELGRRAGAWLEAALARESSEAEATAS